MATQKGSIKYIGTLGGIRHYRYKGLPGFYAGMKGGASAKRIKRDPEFARTRENNREFGGCATFGKAIRGSLGMLIKRLGDGSAAARVVQVAKRINLEDISSKRGERNFQLSNHKKYLENFEFNIAYPLNTTLKCAYSYEWQSKSQFNIIMPPFCAKESLEKPKHATHFRIVVAIGMISDYKYDGLSNNYQSCNPKIPLNYHMQFSEYQKVNDIIMPHSLTAQIADQEWPFSISTIHAVGIEFYSFDGTLYETIESAGSLKIVSVW